MKKIVFTGGAGSGKTTTLLALQSLGYSCIPESAIEVITVLNQQYGVDGQRAWRNPHYVEFQTMIASLQLQYETMIVENIVTFLDRSLLDIVAYCRFFHVQCPAIVLENLQQDRYDLFCLFETIQPFPCREETGRQSRLKDSLKLYEILIDVLEEYQYPYITIPLMTEQDRVEYVLQRIV